MPHKGIRKLSVMPFEKWLELHNNFVLNATQWHQEAFCYAILGSGWNVHF